MLETPSIRWYSFGVTPSSEDVAMSSDNPSGADNQQETERDPQRLHARPECELGEDTVRSSWRHEESGRNDLTTHMRMCGVTILPKVAKFLVG